MVNLPFVFFLLNLRPLKKVVSGQSQYAKKHCCELCDAGFGETQNSQPKTRNN